ncbi:MAG: helix-turn-helix transcriptional regulator [Gemmatimonadetes bacterium]|nr:helix-turn-helix transcriptional regulator [Gemmatimonadota bacterium]
MTSVRMTQVTALILHAVGAGYRYGFDIMDVTGLASGSVYPALRRLERARLLRGKWEDAPAARRGGRPQRRLYELTKAGEDAAAEATKKLANARALLLGSLPEQEA